MEPPKGSGLGPSQSAAPPPPPASALALASASASASASALPVKPGGQPAELMDPELGKMVPIECHVPTTHLPGQKVVWVSPDTGMKVWRY